MENQQNLPFHQIPFSGEYITPEFIQTLKQAGKVAIELQKKGLHAQQKSSKEDLVTEGDTKITELLKLTILKLFPTCQFIDEETKETHTVDISKGLFAVIDPIDGTSNYYKSSLETDPAKKNPNWGISIGFLKDGQLVAGAILQPEANNLYYAEKGKGAYKNGKQIHVSLTNSSANAHIMFSPGYPNEPGYQKVFQAVDLMKEKLPADVIHLGSQVIEAMQIAEGKKDAFFHVYTKPWDIAAACVIISEAGGRCLDTKGQPYKPFGKDILLTNRNLDTTPITDIITQTS